MKSAQITWKPVIKKLPSKKVYYAVADFPGQESAWSVVIEFDAIPSSVDKKVSLGKIRFLSDNAPDYLLDVFKEFSIKEGPFEVGKVEILG